MSNRIKTGKGKMPVNTRSISESVLLLFPLMLVVAVLPLIVKMHTYNSGLSVFDWFITEDEYTDFFLYYKQWFFVIMAGICVIILALRAFIDKTSLKMNRIFIPLGIYALLAFLSTVFSKYRSFGFSGIYEQFENVFCLIGYALMVYYAYLMIQSEEELKLMINFVAIGAIAVGLIGTFQAFGHDIFASKSFLANIVEKGTDPGSIEISFDKGRVYGTLYNPNYVGVYSCLMIPLFSVMVFFAKKVYEYVLYGLVIITSVISLFGSQSKAGLISIAFSVLFILIIMRKILLKRWYITAPVAASIIIAFVVVNHMNNNAYINALSYIFTAGRPNAHALTNIDTYNDHVQVIYQGNVLNISLDNKQLIFTDGDDNEVPYYYALSNDNADLYEISDTRYEGFIPFVYHDGYYPDLEFGFFAGDKSYAFTTTADPTRYLYLNNYYRYSPLLTAESAVFTGHELIGSHRGYIWSRTIPLLKKNILLGSGADTFVTQFPHYDYLTVYNVDYENTFITKPHCFYLQVGVQTGVLSLLALLTFFVMYMIQSLKLYMKNDFTTTASKVGLAVFIGSISFLVSSLSNDSSVCVTPVFYVIIGIGLSANLMQKEAQ